MKFNSILSDKFYASQADLRESSEDLRNYLDEEVAKVSKKITETIDEWCLDNYERATGAIVRHLDYWDVDQFHVIHRQDQNYLVDYTLTHKGQFLSRLIISHDYRYKVANDDGFIDEGEI